MSTHPRDQVQHGAQNTSTETDNVSQGNPEGQRPETEKTSIDKIFADMDERDRRRLELYHKSLAQLMALPTSDIKGRLSTLLTFRNVWMKTESLSFQEFFTGAVAVAQGETVPPRPGDVPEFDPVSSMRMDTLRDIGKQPGREGDNYRDFIQALTPEMAVRYQEWEKVVGDMPETAVEAWKVIGWRIKSGVRQGYSRRSLMRDIGSVLDHFLFEEPDTE